MAAKETLLVTGSSGLIGSALCRAFAQDYDVIGLDKSPPREPVPGVAHLPIDLTDLGSVSAALSEARRRAERVAGVLHLAAYYDFSGRPSPLYREVTVEGTRRLLRGLRGAGLQAAQFVFSSTLLAMKPGEEPLSEDSPTQAEWDYPRSKLETERVLREERGAPPVVVLRIAGVYTDRCDSLPLSRQLQRIRERRLESYFFPGDASHGQSFVHLDDLVDCFRRVVELRASLGPYEVFLIGEEDVLSYRELQELMGELLHGKAWPAIRLPKAAAKAGAWARDKLSGEEAFIKPWMIDLADQHYAVDARKARERLGWTPRRSLRGTLSRIVDGLMRDPRAFYERHGLPAGSAR